ncbi:phosphate ABC transporter permease subunit PstC [Clostridium malenominatum]|uniref:Phosphate transport system permease protein n=1 Tax=Clostridium malenominatum TaxID=1539 RepID=A0ABP3U199_9CLOT
MKNKFWKRIKNEYLGKGFAILCGSLILILTLTIIGFIAVKGINTFTKGDYSLTRFIFSTKWSPDGESPKFGIFTFLAGSTLVSLGAVLLASPVSIALAVFINYISPKLGESILKPALELFVGIPSVVYGWLGITVLLPLIKNVFGGIGFSLFAGILVLSVMILPTISSLSVDALKAIPKDYLEASYGLGATRWQTISRVAIPSAKGGILTAIVLGIARAFGEALAVQMVIGNTVKLPNNLLSPTTTLTSILTMDMANTISGTAWNDALWTIALVLLIVSFLFILIIRTLALRGEIK